MVVCACSHLHTGSMTPCDTPHFHRDAQKIEHLPSYDVPEQPASPAQKRTRLDPLLVSTGHSLNAHQQSIYDLGYLRAELDIKDKKIAELISEVESLKHQLSSRPSTSLSFPELSSLRRASISDPQHWLQAWTAFWSATKLIEWLEVEELSFAEPGSLTLEDQKAALEDQIKKLSLPCPLFTPVAIGSIASNFNVFNTPFPLLPPIYPCLITLYSPAQGVGLSEDELNLALSHVAQRTLPSTVLLPKPVASFNDVAAMSNISVHTTVTMVQSIRKQWPNRPGKHADVMDIANAKSARVICGRLGLGKDNCCWLILPEGRQVIVFSPEELGSSMDIQNIFRDTILSLLKTAPTSDAGRRQSANEAEALRGWFWTYHPFPRRPSNMAADDTESEDISRAICFHILHQATTLQSGRYHAKTNTIVFPSATEPAYELGEENVKVTTQTIDHIRTTASKMILAEAVRICEVASRVMESRS